MSNQTNPERPPYLTVPQTVQATGYTELWVRHLAKKGKVPGAVKIATGKWLLPTEQVDRLVANIATRQAHKEARLRGELPKHKPAPFRARAVNYVLKRLDEDPVAVRWLTAAQYADLVDVIRRYATEPQGAMSGPEDPNPDGNR